MTQITECIVAASTIGDNVILAKNRDRPYKPELEIIRRLINGTEVALLHDRTTGWVEGLNEYGIGLINSALLVGHDEKEKQLVQKSGKKSQDARRVLKALSYDTVADVVRSAVDYDGGIKGHTIIANVKSGVVIEQTSKHQASVKKLNMEDVTVRTNHGYIYPDVGYTEGIKYLSSKIRKISAEKQLSQLGDYHQIARAMREPFYKDPMLNMARDTSEMSTTSQMVINLSTLELLVYIFPSKVEKFEGINNQLPAGYVPKIKVHAFMVEGR